MHGTRLMTGLWLGVVMCAAVFAGEPAARIGDGHTCPRISGTIPHVGGPLLPPGSPNVLIEKLPAALVGGTATCVGPPDTLIQGSATVRINGQSAVRVGDRSSHGGVVITGAGTVMIGS